MYYAWNIMPSEVRLKMFSLSKFVFLGIKLSQILKK